MKQKEHFGYNSISALENILRREYCRSVFLVTGKKSFGACGAKEKIERIFRQNSCQHTRFCDFSPNPKVEEIQRGFAQFKRYEYDCIIGVGGGSAIDVAKAIKLFSFKQLHSQFPLIAIPTTAGSGSEATHFIVYYVGKEKQSEGTPHASLPNYSICDPQFTLELPSDITASTGMDALAQAIESYWNINSTAESKKFARQAIRLALGNLEKAVNMPDKKSRENMLRAAHLSGKAINITKTTACHSISYPITAYFGISHGNAVGVTLGELLKYNFWTTEKDCNDERGARYVRESVQDLVHLMGKKTIVGACCKLASLMDSIGLETSLSRLGVDEIGVETIIQNGFKPERVKNNPRLLTKEALRKILENIK